MRAFRLCSACGVLVIGAGVIIASAPPALASLTLPAAAAAGSSRVTVGSPPDSTPQNQQSEPAVAIDAAQPNIVAAGANDTIDWRPCPPPQAKATQGGTCFDHTTPVDYGVGISGVYFSFDRGHSWVQPTYTGLTARDCAPTGPCPVHTGPTGTLPWYSENGLVSHGDPAVAFGPIPVNGQFSWATGHDIYQERIGDYVYAAATATYGAAVWTDLRNAAVCNPVQDWRAASSAEGERVPGAPWPLADCPGAWGTQTFMQQRKGNAAGGKRRRVNLTAVAAGAVSGIVTGGVSGYLASVYAAGPVVRRQAAETRRQEAMQQLGVMIRAYSSKLNVGRPGDALAAG